MKHVSSQRLLFAFAATFCFVLALSPMASGQSLDVSGRVLGSDGPEVGVVISVVGGAANSITDQDGYYSIQVPNANSVLLYSLLGYKEQRVSVQGRSVVNVRLEEEHTSLDEVVVIGYGTQRKEFVVGSVSQVSSKDLLKAPVTNVQNMLAGRLSGMTTIQQTGTPGDDSARLLVRGFSTFNDSSPLMLVDGVEMPMSQLNPNDIASVTVLKDAATAAVYGVKAANGVILVTTKSGLRGRSSISYDGSVTFDLNTAMPKMLNAQDYIYWHNLARTLDGQTPYWTDGHLANMKAKGILGDTDWLSEIYKKFGLTQNHNISATGGNERVRYYASIGYNGQDGILRNTDFSRYNFRANVEANLAQNLDFMINVSGSHSDRHWPGLGITAQSEFSPITRAFYALPLLTKEYEGLPLGYYNGVYTYSPIASLNTGYQHQRRWNAEIRSQLSYKFDAIKPLKGLKALVFFAYNFGYTLDHNFLETYKNYSYNPLNESISLLTSDGIPESNFNKSHSSGFQMTIRPQLSYEREFAGKHNVTGLFLFERYYSHSDTMTGYKKGYFSDNPVDISMGMENQSPFVSGSHGNRGMASFVGKLGYAYAKRYMVEATLRADGSYKFAPQNRWGYFPSVALGWVLSEESFLKGKADWLDWLKLRASFGILGSDDTDPYLYLQTYKVASYPIVIGGQPQSAYYTSGYVYDNLTWSRTNTWNVGFETRMFRNRFSFEFDWFYKLTTRILESEQSGSTYAPSLGGNNPIWVNSGSVDNRGFDMTIKWGDRFSSGWSYSLTGILSWSRNRVLQKKISDNHPSYRAVLGQPIGSIYGFNALGLFQTQEQVDNYPTAPSGTAALGEIMYEDINGDGKIDSMHDFVKIGRSRVPEMVFSLNFEVGWKGLNLSALLQGAALCNYSLTGTYKNGSSDNTMYTRAFYGSGNAPYYLVENSWRPDNTDAKYPRLRSSYNANNGWSSSFWIVDGSYLRLKNLQLSYTLPEKLFSKESFLQNVMVYVAGTNLLTFSGFKYIDPENPGINNGYYPQQRTFSLGLKLTF